MFKKKSSNRLLSFDENKVVFSRHREILDFNEQILRGRESKMKDRKTMNLTFTKSAADAPLKKKL